MEVHEPDINENENNNPTEISQPNNTNETPQVQQLHHESDLPNEYPYPVDFDLQKVYGDYIHLNNGSHLNDGVLDDFKWQQRWKVILALPTRRFNAPKGRVGKRYISILSNELAGIKKRKWNSERFLIFQAVILQKAIQIKSSKEIRNRIDRRLDAWLEGSYDLLIQDTMRAARRLSTKGKQQMNDIQLARIFQDFYFKEN